MTVATALLNDWLKLTFQAIPIADIADNDATSPLGNLFMSLHSANPGATGNQQSSEITYTPYARQSIARSPAGFAVSANNIVTPVGNVVFPQSSSGASVTATFAVIGSLVSGAGRILLISPLSQSLVIAPGGIIPTITPSMLERATVSFGI